MADARSELRELRQTVSAVAAQHGLAIFAAGTHPTALWREAQQTPTKRYDMVMHDLQMIGQRDLLCGLHVHVELPDPDERVDVMYRMLPYLPLVSSAVDLIAILAGPGAPVSRATATPRMTSCPAPACRSCFRTREEFDAYVAALVRAGVIADSSYIWWAIRPSLNHPTLELRAPDSCTLVEDSHRDRCALSHARASPLRQSLAQCRSRCGGRAPSSSRTNGGRSATACTALSSRTTARCRSAEMLDQVIDDTAADAAALGCAAEIDRCRAIVGSGTSADVQLAVFEAHSANARSRRRVARGDRLDRGRDVAVSFLGS